LTVASVSPSKNVIPRLAIASRKTVMRDGGSGEYVGEGSDEGDSGGTCECPPCGLCVGEGSGAAVAIGAVTDDGGAAGAEPVTRSQATNMLARMIPANSFLIECRPQGVLNGLGCRLRVRRPDDDAPERPSA